MNFFVMHDDGRFEPVNNDHLVKHLDDHLVKHLCDRQTMLTKEGSAVPAPPEQRYSTWVLVSYGICFLVGVFTLVNGAWQLLSNLL